MSAESDAATVALRSNETFLGRCAVAISIVAGAVLVEADSTTYYPERLAWARTALADPRAEAERMAWAILSDATLAGEAASDIDAEISTMETDTFTAQVVAILDGWVRPQPAPTLP